jgi:hypothetical protein
MGKGELIADFLGHDFAIAKFSRRTDYCKNFFHKITFAYCRLRNPAWAGLRCASFRVHCGVHEYASFHEIRDALNLNFLLCRLNFDFLETVTIVARNLE